MILTCGGDFSTVDMLGGYVCMLTNIYSLLVIRLVYKSHEIILPKALLTIPRHLSVCLLHTRPLTFSFCHLTILNLKPNSIFWPPSVFPLPVMKQTELKEGEKKKRGLRRTSISSERLDGVLCRGKKKKRITGVCEA